MSLRPYAEAIEARFLQIEAVIDQNPPAGVLGRFVWDNTFGLRQRFPFLQEAMAAAAHLPVVSLAREDVAEMRENRVALPAEAPDALPAGREPVGGARFAGYVEQALGGSLPVLFRKWCEQEARELVPVPQGRGFRLAAAEFWTEEVARKASAMFGDAAEQARFSRLLVDHALGLAKPPIDGSSPVEGFVWHAATVVFAPEHLSEFSESAARAMFADAWASSTDENVSGLDVLDAAPATPPDALLEGYRLAGRYEAANGRSIDELLRTAQFADCGYDTDTYRSRSDVEDGLPAADEFGRVLALQAVGAGVDWSDRRTAFPLEVPSFEYGGPNGCETDPDDELEATGPAPRF